MEHARHTPSFNLRQLRYFATVCEEQQITRAADLLHLAQPALSQAIARLEAGVGVQLLVRTRSGVHPTAAGEAFLQKARSALAANDELHASLLPWRPGATLRLGYRLSAQALARPIVRRFTLAEPGIGVQIIRLGAAERLRELKAGRIDAELVDAPSADPDLHIEVIAHAQRHVILAEAHPKAHKDTLQFLDIVDETFPSRHPSVPEQWADEGWLTDLRGSRPAVTIETPLGLDELWALVGSGKCVAILPAFQLPLAVGHGVRGIRLTDVEPMAIALARRKRDNRPAIELLFATARGMRADESEAPTPAR